ncbi:MAG: hypothetical protein ACKV2O_06160 [Acidimicrobiales bacterium]
MSEQTTAPTRLRTTVICDGEEHQIRWQRGAVVLEDHPDPLADLALCALGGTWSSCIAVLSMIRSRFDPVGTWPVWTGPLPRAGGPQLMQKAWNDLLAARHSAPPGEEDRYRLQSAEDRWAMAVLNLVEPALRWRLALDAVVGRCRRSAGGPPDPFNAGTLRRGFSRRDGRGPLAESIMFASLSAPPGASLVWLLESHGDKRSARLGTHG